MKNSFLLLSFVVMSFFAFGQTPQAFKYQAVARDLNGNPVINQVISVKISILAGNPEGEVIYSEIHQTTSNSLGLINLEVGRGNTVTGNFTMIAWGNNASFIKTEMDITGGGNFVFMGTSQLLSVPYSLFSNNGVPDGQNPGDMLYWNGTQWLKVNAGLNGQVLTFNDGVPVWGGVQLPILYTSAVTSISAFTANCGGTVVSDGGSPVIARGICWNSLPNPTTANNKTINGSGTGAFSGSMTGLAASSVYYVRAYATNSAGTSYGNEVSFTTTNGGITLTTTAIIAITVNSATSGGNITNNGGSGVMARGVCWNTSPFPTTANSKTTNGSGNGAFVSELTGLAPNTLYYVRAYATNSLGTSYGNQLSFTTLNGIISLTTNEVTEITATSAISGGEITNDGGSTVTARGVCWSNNQNPTITDSKTNDGSGNGVFVSNLTSLLPDTTYYVKAYATNGVGTFYGNEVSFTTISGIVTISTTEVTDITASTAISGGEITNDGGSTVTARGVCWSISQSPTIANSTTNDGSGNGIFVSNLTGLLPDTLYFVRSYATNGVGTFYGNEVSFTTQNGIITLITAEVTEITATAAISGGDITNDGGSPVTARGVCWSTFQNPTIADSTTNDGSGNSVFVSSLNGLLPDTLYYVRAYALNGVGTYYGSQVSFTTQSGIISLTTTEVTQLTAISAISGGEITNDGGSLVTARGVCWSTTQNPTIADSITNDGSGNGVFLSSLTSLLPDTLYYVRSYAINGVGTYYGNEESFTTLKWSCGLPIADTCDGKNYNTVQIGTQCWMKENLNVGARINGATNQTNNGTIEKYCYDNSEANCDVFGGLYQWDEMMDYFTTPGIQGICPTGWHLPTDAEWCTIMTYLDITVNCSETGWSGTNAGGKMKEAGTTHWASPNTGATNSSGFRGLPGGDKGTGGVFNLLSSDGIFWCSTEYSTTIAWYRSLRSYDAKVNRYNANKDFGFSVRCLRETSLPVNELPEIPSNPSPEQGTINQLLNTILSWICSDPENDPLIYDVYFGTENPPSLVSSSQSETFYNPGYLNYNNMYYWKIVARDNHVNTIEGPLWTFTTIPLDPGFFLLPINWIGDIDITTFREPTILHAGSMSCGIIINSGTQANCDLNNDIPITVNEGNNFKVSFWAVTSLHVRITAALDWVGASGTYTQTYVGPATNGWEKFEFLSVVPTGASAVKLRLRFYDISGFEAPETQYIDDIEFESPVGTILPVSNGDFETW